MHKNFTITLSKNNNYTFWLLFYSRFFNKKQKKPNSIISFVWKKKSLGLHVTLFYWALKKNDIFLAIPLVLQKFSWTYQTLLDKVNENIYRPLWYVGVFIIGKFLGIRVFRVWEGGLESNNSNEMVTRKIVASTNIACTIRAIDVGKT